METLQSILYPLFWLAIIAGIIVWGSAPHRRKMKRLAAEGQGQASARSPERPKANTTPPAATPAKGDAPIVVAPLPLGEWWPMVQAHPERTPHVAVLGPSGEGKSTMMQALASTRDGLIFVIQPNCQAGEWPGVPVIECDDDGSFTAIGAALGDIRAEFTRRGGAMKKGDAGPWLTIIWDEVPLTIGKLGKPARELMVDLLSAGRPRKMRVIIGSTSDRVGALGIEGYGDLLESCAIIRLGSFAVAEVPTLEDVPYAATLELRRKVTTIDRRQVPVHAARTIDPSRCWSKETPEPTNETANDDAPRPLSEHAQKLLAAIEASDKPLTRTAMQNAVFGNANNHYANKIDRALEELRAAGKLPEGTTNYTVSA